MILAFAVIQLLVAGPEVVKYLDAFTSVFCGPGMTIRPQFDSECSQRLYELISWNFFT